MNGPQHYAEAERILHESQLAIDRDDIGIEELSVLHIAAQAHATLALTGAIIDAHDNQPGLDESGRSLRQWRDVNDDDAEEGFRNVPATGWARVMEW